jgi:hypothetical protein
MATNKDKKEPCLLRELKRKERAERNLMILVGVLLCVAIVVLFLFATGGVR